MTQKLIDHTLTEGQLTQFGWLDYNHILLLAQEGGQLIIMKGLHKPHNQVCYVPLYKLQSTKEVMLNYCVLPAKLNLERGPSYFLKLENNASNLCNEVYQQGNEDDIRLIQ